MTIRCRDCGATLPEECNCTVSGSDSMLVSGDGSAGSPYAAGMRVAATPGLINLVSVLDGRLDARFPDRAYRPTRVRVKRASPLVIPSGPNGVNVTFEEVLRQTEGFTFFDPTFPDRIRAPFRAYWGFGALISFSTLFTGTNFWEILLMPNGGTTPIAVRSRNQTNSPSGTASWGDSLSVYHDRVFEEGEYFVVNIRTEAGGEIAPSEDVTNVAYMTWIGDVA